jgi:hypothetical protein
MAQLALIIGNGFDIDMGIRSRYSDFADSPEFYDLTRRMRDMFYEEERDKSLVLQLQQAYMVSNWFDIEKEIHNYVVNHSDLNDNLIRLIRSEFDELKKALANYLKRITTNFTAKTDKMSTYLLYKLRECPLTVAEIYFNYTYPNGFLKLPLQPEIFNGAQHWFTYVHGSLRDNDIVLGCDLQEGEKVNRQLSFMYKYNMLNKANHVARHILEAKEIIFFGHSINEMDFSYFREFFKVASASPNPIRHLTIITYDEESERTIKDNIRNQGVSVSDLYSNLWTFDFIHTKKVYNGDQKEIQKYDKMIQRLMAKDREGI